ncbi:hypothetical protein ANO11243_084040 [Dothideomycetidae sp. 11243]|nr:hypothetical protein ANO11243_084040 [fungal sp. No.11243]
MHSHNQLQSPLFRLPPELRNYIFDLSLTTTEDIVDPITPSDDDFCPSQDANRTIPALGIGLLSTCKRASSEISLAALYCNDISFTTPSHIFSLLDTSPITRKQLTRVTLSLRETRLMPASTDGTPCSPLAQQWLHFLTCLPRHSHYPTAWCARFPTLGSALPDLTHLIIDLTGMAPYRHAEMANLGIKTGYALALSRLLCGLAHRKPIPFDSSPMLYGNDSSASNEEWTYSHRSIGNFALSSLIAVEIRGYGAHMWDLGDTVRPTVGGKWHTISAWTELVGRVLLPWLLVSLSVERPWVGLLQGGNMFGLVALASAPSTAQVQRMGYERGTAWDEVLRMTREKQRDRHPVFELFT